MLRDDKVIFRFIGPMGVPVELGQSLGLLIVLIVLISQGLSLGSLIFAAMLVGTIFLHELGHAWGCKVQGVPVRRIMLHGGGGFCEHARSVDPRQEELIVAMGPIVNLGLWAVASLAQWMMVQNLPTVPTPFFIDVYSYLGIFAFLNLAFFIFNMIPVQPLDGGKLCHLVLLRMLPPSAAHRLTGLIGLVLSILWIPAAIVAWVEFGWILFFIPSIPAHYRMARGQLA